MALCQPLQTNSLRKSNASFTLSPMPRGGRAQTALTVMQPRKFLYRGAAFIRSFFKYVCKPKLPLRIIKPF